jgi:hypothetical protein
MTVSFSPVTAVPEIFARVLTLRVDGPRYSAAWRFVLLDEIEHASIADETWHLADNYCAVARNPPRPSSSPSTLK